MKIKLQQFLASPLHSWAQVGHSLANAFLELNHEVDLCSTDGTHQIPDSLRPFLKTEDQLDPSYDCQISYTAPHNFPHYLSRGNKNRFGIWNYETDIIPKHLIKYWNCCDLVLPSSQFSFDIFAKCGAPVNKMRVISHGIDLKQFRENISIYPLKTKKSKKILVNIAQPHLRKNLPGVLSAFGKAFTNKDNVALILKIVIKPPKQPHDVDVKKIINDFYSKFPKHGELELITDFITDISSLYRSCDILFSMSHSENFWLPGIEACALEKLIICPNYGGQLDFLSNENSFLIPGRVVKAPLNLQYWTASPYASIFDPNINDASDLLKEVVNNYDLHLNNMRLKLRSAADNLSWLKIADQIIKLTN